jgi:DNA-directed RNA polymerase beta subunit
MSSSTSNMDSPNNLNIDDVFKFMDLYYNRHGILYSHLYNSFNKFLDEDIKNFLETGEHVFFEKITKDKVIRYKFKYENVSIKEPTLDNEAEPMFPSDARNRGITYGAKVIARVLQIQEVIDIASDKKTERTIGHFEENIPIVTNLPIMVKSKFCSLNIHKGYDKSECEYDPGGYFIVGASGSEKVIIPQDRMCDNKPLVFLKKESGVEFYVAQVNSKSYKPHGLTQIISLKLKKDGNIHIRVPILNEVSVYILLRALGIETDKDIINYITSNEKDYEMIDLVRTGLEHCRNEKGQKIRTQQDAYDFLLSKLRVIKKYTETDQTLRNQQRKKHLETLLEHNFLPHMDNRKPIEKGYYVCYVVNKLLSKSLGRSKPDDRDSYLNKRVDLPGDLLMELFKQYYRKMMNECTKFFKKRNTSDDEPTNIINQIKPNIIEQGIKGALSTGAWPRRKGVAQVLQRLTYLQTICFLRRVDAPGGDASSLKLTSPRQLHPSSVGFLCCVTGDTEITMANGKKEQIKNMKNGDEIISIYKEDLRQEITEIQNYFSRMSEKLYKITTITGETLKCTHDHPILTSSRKMVDAELLSVGDEIIVINNNNEGGYDKYRIETNIYSIPIMSKEIIPNEMVYDFETKNPAHTLIANNIVTSNCVQTPEHAKIGLTKHLALIGSITVMQTSQLNIIKGFLRRKLMNLKDLPSKVLSYMSKVFLNGEWLGMIDKPVELENEIRENKLKGKFDPTMGIVHKLDEREIHIFSDTGRMYRPAIRVEDNKMMLTKKLINTTSINKMDKDKKITTWEEFMLKNPGVIEYIDMEEQPFLMVSESHEKLEKNRKIMEDSIKKVKNIKDFKVNTIENRYDDLMYARYSHCEFHPSFLLGEISTNTPFSDNNAGSRTLFNYAQTRQSMGIYISNYRDRLDISYILYHVQRPLVSTRTSKYTYTDVLPAGENAVVAIACYTGLMI